MDKFYKKSDGAVTAATEGDIQMQIIEWWAQDETPDEADERFDENEEGQCEHCTKPEAYCRCNLDAYTIRCFGVTDAGVSVTCKITNFKPFYYIKVPNDFNRLKLQKFLEYVQTGQSLKYYPTALYKENGQHRSIVVERKDLFGFRNGRKYKFVKLVFNNYAAMTKSRYLFKKATNISGVTTRPTKFKLYESNFEPFMRYCHLKDILTAGWIKLPRGKYRKTNDTASTQIEVEIDKRDVVSLREKQSMARFLQASWDIEVYSHDYTFPSPKQRQNEIFQIATTYKYHGDDSVLVKHLLTLKKCAPIDDPNVIVEECASERDLIKRWVDTISNMDPDIFYTYNGDSFDCIYLIERALLCGLAVREVRYGKEIYKGYVLDKLSRISQTPCDLKKEYFSSSAYGDSDFYRLYVPGRLNYDLLIHYKRGMKKYSSYKLDSIAGEILNEGKHDVSAKEMFKLYERGSKEDIKRVGQYCIQDTDLLQKLVDKQLILTNIVQLANVTFVPIGFLTTRGQTIKVYSQLLRKARQMEFLVPHTNFNEDAYPVLAKMAEAGVVTEDDIGTYVKVKLESRMATGGGGGVPGTAAPTELSGKISEIIDDTTVVILADTELPKEYFNRQMSFNRKTLLVTRLYPGEDLVDDSFTGATVLEPNPGMYMDNVAILDFASLYPTIQISRNLCYSTFVMDPKYLDKPDVDYETIAWDDKIEYKIRHTCEGVGKSGKSKGMVCGKQAYFDIDGHYYCRIHDPVKKERSADEKFQKRDVSYSYTIVQPHTDPETGEIVNKGVLPSLLEELYSERKRVKREMAKALADGDKNLADILDSTQLAIKISLNSVYGYLGRNQGNLICKPLGQLTTSIGRMLIEQSKEFVEGDFTDYVRENNLVTHKLKQVDVSKMSKGQKAEVLALFKI